MADATILIWMLISTLIESFDTIVALIIAAVVLRWLFNLVLLWAPSNHPSDYNPSPTPR